MANGGAAMASGDVSAAWGAYLGAIEDLYGVSAGALIESRVEIAELNEETVDATIERSREFGGAIAANLRSERSRDFGTERSHERGAKAAVEGSEQRELAMLQLAAAAVVDFSIAHDLARQAEETEPDVFAEAGLSDTLGEVIAILEAPPRGGLWSLIIAGGAPPAPRGPAEALRAAADSALVGIRDETGQTVTVTLGNPLETLAGMPLEAASKPIAQLVGLIDGAISWVLRKAVEFVLRGVAKLLTVFGDRADSARAKVIEWAERPLGENAVVGLLDSLYRTKQASVELSAAIAGAPPGREAAMRMAAGEIGKLETKFRRQMQTIATVARAVGKVAPWLVAIVSPAAPWAQPVLAAVYCATTAYSVFAGGDYIDWPGQDGGLLDLVYGVRSMVEDTVV